MSDCASSLPCHPDLFDLLICPEAKVPVKWTGGWLISTDGNTRRAYRVDGDIPVMLVEESRVLSPSEWQAAMGADGPVGQGVAAVQARARR